MQKSINIRDEDAEIQLIVNANRTRNIEPLR